MSRGNAEARQILKLLDLLDQVCPPLYQDREVLVGDILMGLAGIDNKALEALAGQGEDGLIKFKEDNPGVFQSIRPRGSAGKGRMIRLKYCHDPSLSGDYVWKLLTFWKKTQKSLFYYMAVWQKSGKIFKNFLFFVKKGLIYYAL
jgi:hypothetical protein